MGLSHPINLLWCNEWKSWFQNTVGSSRLLLLFLYDRYAKNMLAGKNTAKKHNFTAWAHKQWWSCTFQLVKEWTPDGYHIYSQLTGPKEQISETMDRSHPNFSGFFIWLKKLMKFCHLKQHRWTWRALGYVKLSDRERQILYDNAESEKYTQLVNTKKGSRSTNKENKLEVTSGERDGRGQHRGREIRGTKYCV